MGSTCTPITLTLSLTLHRRGFFLLHFHSTSCSLCHHMIQLRWSSSSFNSWCPSDRQSGPFYEQFNTHKGILVGRMRPKDMNCYPQAFRDYDKRLWRKFCENSPSLCIFYSIIQLATVCVQIQVPNGRKTALVLHLWTEAPQCKTCYQYQRTDWPKRLSVHTLKKRNVPFRHQLDTRCPLNGGVATACYQAVH